MLDNKRIITLVLVVFVGIATIGAVMSIQAQSILMLQFLLVVANFVMAGVVAIQALATAESAEQVKRQAELMNKSLLEMKKDRMNMEYIKNEVVGYITALENMLSGFLREARPAYLELPIYSALDFDTSDWKGYQKRGLEERVKRKIQKLLEEYGINLEEYNSLAKEVNHLRREAIDALENEPELMESLQRISQEGAKKLTIKQGHIVKPDVLLEALVTLFSTKRDSGLSAPPYGILGLDPKTESLYGLEVWNKAKKELYKFLGERPEVYNTLVKREESLRGLKELTKKFLNRIHKIEELSQDEDKFEEKLMEL